MSEELRVREYGNSGPPVIVLHGGPGAAGDVAPLARELGKEFRVLEPWQRGSGSEPLTVARHVADLHALIESKYKGVRPALVGHSWGAMLALAYAATYPGWVSTVVLIACGTFDQKSRARLRETLEERMDDDLRRKIAELPVKFPDPNERLREMFRLTRPLYDCRPEYEDEDPDAPPFDVRAHSETWADMLRLQEEGVYPAAFAVIDCPALMMHGMYDPHPGEMIYQSLIRCIPHMEFNLWGPCGHYPWLESIVREEFLITLAGWIYEHPSDQAAKD